MRTFGALTSLLLSTALLLVGHGMHLTLLPLRAAALGQGDLLIALGGSAYFAGFVIGCLLAARVIARAGHIRSFAVLACTMTAALLALGLSEHWAAWLALRLLIGMAICGLYTVIESWLNDQADASNRGSILAVYTFLVLVSMAFGQLLVNASPIATATPFMLVAMIVAIAVIPVGMTRRLAPAPVEPTRASFRKLYRRSHTAFAGALLSGAVSGSFWALGALYAQRAFGTVADVTLFMTLGILGGALFQYPFGWLSDRVGRPQILVLLCFLGTASSAATALASGGPWLLLAVFAFGATAMPLYAMSLATVADKSERHEFVEIGTSVLLLNGVGATVAPLFIGRLMELLEASMLFWSCSALCALTGVFALVRLRTGEAAEHPVPFSAAASAAAPASFEMDPRAPEAPEGDVDNSSGSAKAQAAEQNPEDD
jgi:MFS family permease